MSSSDHPELVFFVSRTGLPSRFDPYAAIGCPRDARQEDVASRLGGDVSSDARAILEMPARRLAWHLLAPPESPPRAADFARALRDPAARRSTAAHLLAEAISREIAGVTGAPAVELWTTVDRVFCDLARDPAMATELGALAARLGLPESAAADVLAAIPVELLPGLHLLFAAATRDAEHRAFHLRHAGGAPDHPLAAKARAALWAAALGEARQHRAECAPEQALRAYLTVHPDTAIEQVRLATEIGALAADLGSRAETYPLAVAQRRSRALEEVLRALPFDPRIPEALAKLCTRCGALLVEAHGRFDEGGAYLARAVALDPGNPEPAQRLAAYRRKLQEVGEALHAAQRAGHTLSAAGEAIFDEARRGMRQAIELERSGAAQRMRELYTEACQTQLAARLGLDPSAPGTGRAAQALLAALSVRGEDAEPFEALRARISAEHPALADAPWDALRAPIEGGGPVTCATLIGALPPPPSLPAQVGDPDLRQAFARPGESPSYEAHRAPRRIDRARIYPWLFSPADTGAKLAAVGGLLLTLVGGSMLGWNALAIHRRDSAYADLQAAVTEEKPGDVIRAAQRFIHDTAEVADDYRAPEVAQAYDRALLQEIAAATSHGTEEDLTRLLAYARGLEAWAPLREGAELEGRAP